MQPLTDYSFYISQGYILLSEPDFNAVIMPASAYIDRITFGRSRTVTEELINRVKCACCAVADAMYKTSNGVITSASNDGYTESYAVGSTSEQLYSAAAPYLLITGLMYCGGRQYADM